MVYTWNFPPNLTLNVLIKTYNIIIHFPKWAEVTVLNAEYYFKSIQSIILTIFTIFFYSIMDNFKNKFFN